MAIVETQASSVKAISKGSENSLEWITNDLANVIAQAYRDGEQKGKKTAYKAMIEQIQKDFDIAKKIYEAFYQTLWANKIKCDSIRVRFAGPYCFEAIFIIPTKDYYSDGFGKALELSKSFSKHPSPRTSLHYKFMPYSKKIDYEAMKLDGFLTSYAPK
jgi:hypothetical protein